MRVFHADDMMAKITAGPGMPGTDPPRRYGLQPPTAESSARFSVRPGPSLCWHGLKGHMARRVAWLEGSGQAFAAVYFSASPSAAGDGVTVSQCALLRETDLAAATRRGVPSAWTIPGSGDDGSTATGGGCTESQQDGENDVFHCNSPLRKGLWGRSSHVRGKPAGREPELSSQDAEVGERVTAPR